MDRNEIVKIIITDLEKMKVEMMINKTLMSGYYERINELEKDENVKPANFIKAIVVCQSEQEKHDERLNFFEGKFEAYKIVLEHLGLDLNDVINETE